MIVFLLIGLAFIGHALAGPLGVGVALVGGTLLYVALVAWTDDSPW